MTSSHRVRRTPSAGIVDVAVDVYAWLTAQAAWRASCARLATHLPRGAGLRILDLGCGPGVSTFELARVRPDASLVGLDLTMRMLEQARRRLPGAGLGLHQVHWLRADARRLPFRTASLDAVTTHSVLYFVPGAGGGAGGEPPRVAGPVAPSSPWSHRSNQPVCGRSGGRAGTCGSSSRSGCGDRSAVCTAGSARVPLSHS